MNSIRQIK